MAIVRHRYSRSGVGGVGLKVFFFFFMMAELLAEVLTPVQMTREQQSTTKVNH